MAWGWMRAMKKRALYLIETDCAHMADTTGLLYGQLSWDDPQPGIIAAINAHVPRIARGRAGDPAGIMASRL
jgi:hypothetical protein